MLARVVRTPPTITPPITSTSTRTHGISIEVAGARIVVRAGFDRAVLGAVIDVLVERAHGGHR